MRISDWSSDVCSSDLVTAESAVFGVYCRRWGVPLIDGGTVRLPRIVGQGRALDMILTGRPVAADEAHRIGLADRVVADGTALAAAVELAKQIAAFPQICMNKNGRASCRERVFPVRVEPGGRRTIKQKNKKNTTKTP